MIWGYALTSVLAKCYAVVAVGLLHEEPEPIEWKELHVGAERCITCEHMHGVIDEYSTAAVEVAGRSARCQASGVLHVPDCVCGRFRCKNGASHCQVFRDVQDLNFHGDPQTHCGSTSGGDEGREEFCMLRE